MNLNKIVTAAVIIVGILTSSAYAEGRYQAHWNGKSYLVIDSENGHLWTYHGDSIVYNGRVDGDEFEPPEAAQIWQQRHGKWSKK